MILLTNGWHPDVVANMAHQLSGKVHRIVDCTWIKTNDKHSQELDIKEKAKADDN